jgi:hypothetical protein
MPTYYSSGTNAISSTAAGSIALISSISGPVDTVIITNGGAVDGEFSLDGGTTWGPMKAYTTMLLDNLCVTQDIYVRRDPAGSSDISAVKGWAAKTR